MHQNKSVVQVAQNIWRVTRWKETRENRKSWFIKEPEQAFTPCSAYTCSETEAGLLQFGLNGQTVLSESDTPFTQGFSISETDGIYGLGMQQDQAMNRRGMVCQLLQINPMKITVPFFTSNGGYAVLVDSCAFMSIGIDKPCTSEMLDRYDTEETAPNQIQIYADDADEFTYYVILGQTIDEQIHGYRLLTGKSPMFARWAYGYFQSREHYQTQEELLSVAKKFRELHIPLDCIVQDWNYWGDLGWNALEWDKKKYPDPDAMIQQIHDMDMKMMISVWPSFGPQTQVCKELEAKGMILKNKVDENEHWGRVYDAYNPAAADIVWSHMDKTLFSKGIDAWWLDSTEPAYEKDNSRLLLDASDNCLGSNRRYLNSFGATSSRNFYQRQRAKTSDKRAMILTRSGYAGQQASATVSWTGDIGATWEIFKQQIPALLSFSISGVPYSTTDIGAFFIKQYPDCDRTKTENPEFRELYTRWFWFGVFSPVFRSHGTTAPREMWYFGQPGTPYYDSQMTASRLRYALMPYIYANAFRVYSEDDTLMRPLIMDFPLDPKVRSIGDTYMFGRDLLVHAVTDYQKRTADVYLPAGTEWINFFTGERYQGGQTVTVDAPLDQIPLFVRAGSMILMTEPAECTARQKEQVLKLHIYTGSDCSTFYYQDDGDNYSYESGNFAKIPFCWNDAARKLTIGAPAGKAENFDLTKTIEVYVNDTYVRTVGYAAAAEEFSF